jgi:hypothetical protein
LAIALVGACSNIIGVSDYEIDPKLDEGNGTAGSEASGGSDGGGSDTGGTNSGGKTAGGTDTGGATPGGADTGGTEAGGMNAGGATPGGEGGSGGALQSECETAGDCDDTIDCTTDTCNASGSCVHTAKDTLCDATLCETCQLGIGCVAGPMTTTQLLLDPSFDGPAGDWDETSSDGINVSTVAGAQSGTKVAKFGPAANNATEQQYSDLLQYVTIPAGTVGLTLKGYYKLTPGVKAPADDYLVAAFYEDGEVMPAAQFHSFEATAGAQATWKAFSYSAPKADVAVMVGQEFSFDLVAHVWDTVFQFDTLQLNATVCQ